jgi:hypothetical protein
MSDSFGKGYLPSVPDCVLKLDQTIVKWQDVPEIYQKKILTGTMTDEDWDSDWDIPPVAKKPIEDVVSDKLNASSEPVVKHLHVWRKEYRTCMIKGCGHVRPLS